MPKLRSPFPSKSARSHSRSYLSMRSWLPRSRRTKRRHGQRRLLSSGSRLQLRQGNTSLSTITPTATRRQLLSSSRYPKLQAMEKCHLSWSKDSSLQLVSSKSMQSTNSILDACLSLQNSARLRLFSIRTWESYLNRAPKTRELLITNGCLNWQRPRLWKRHLLYSNRKSHS